MLGANDNSWVLPVCALIIGILLGSLVTAYYEHNTGSVMDDFVLTSETIRIEKECPRCEETSLTECLNIVLDAQKQLSEVDTEFRKKRLMWS